LSTGTLTRIARRQGFPGGLTDREAAMNDPSAATTCLHSLLGDDMYALPPSFLPRLDHFLAEGRALVDASNRANIAYERDIEALGAVLEVLEAAQLERGNDGEQGLLGEDIVRGLLIAARRLTACLGSVSSGGSGTALD